MASANRLTNTHSEAKQATKQAIASHQAGPHFRGFSIGDLRCRIWHKRITVTAQRQTLP